MSSFFDDASLVQIPSGYKVGTLFSIKPTDGTGDLTFTRTADTATRVGPDGLIEKVRTNLVTYSQAFDNAAYNKGTGGSVSANTVVAPDGTTTADAYTWATATGSYAYLSQSVVGTSQIPNTFSIYIKRPTGSGSRTLRLVISDVIATTAISSDFTITESWQRFEFTRTSGSSTGYVGIGFVPGSAGVPIAGGEVLDIWGAQLETGDIATDYIATTTAAVSVGPVANLPRLDYLGSTCGKLLLEPQRTNLALYSEQMNNTGGWQTSAANVTANQTTSPDGYENADLLTVTSSSGSLYTNDIVVSSSTVYTWSFYAKQGTATQSYLAIRDQTNGVFISSDVQYTATSTEWTRVTYTFTTPVTCTSVRCYCQRFAGGGLGTHFFYGAQLEAGAYETSYIPTLGAAVTRGQDVASKTGISSLIGQSEGTAFIECTADTTNSNGAMLIYLGSSDGGGAFNYSTYLLFSSTSLNLVVYSSGAIFVNSISTQTYTNNETIKAAFGYKNNDFVCYANGVQLFTDTSGTVSTNLSSVSYGSYPLNLPFNQYNGKISQALLFTTRLTNAQLAELTTI